MPQGFPDASFAYPSAWNVRCIHHSSTQMVTDTLHRFRQRAAMCSRRHHSMILRTPSALTTDTGSSAPLTQSCSSALSDSASRSVAKSSTR